MLVTGIPWRFIWNSCREILNSFSGTTRKLFELCIPGVWLTGFDNQLYLYVFTWMYLLLTKAVILLTINRSSPYSMFITFALHLNHSLINRSSVQTIRMPIIITTIEHHHLQDRLYHTCFSSPSNTFTSTVKSIK